MNYYTLKNFVIQAEMESRENKIRRYMIMYKGIQCPHELDYDGLFCGDCALGRHQKKVNFWDIPIVEDKRVPAEHPVSIIDQNSDVIEGITAMSPGDLFDDSNVTEASRVAFEIISSQLEKLSKEQLQELYKKLYDSYDCRVYK